MASDLTARLGGARSALAIKAPCRVATTANIALTGTQTIDGVAIVAGDRVLVKDQTDATENGIYVCKATAWARDRDFDGNDDIVTGTRVHVHSGTVGAGFFYEVTTANPITIGTSSIEFDPDYTLADINDLEDRSAFASGDKFAIWEAGVGLRKVDYDDLPSNNYVFRVGSSDFSYRLGGNYSSIDSTVTSSFVFDGGANYPNKLGVTGTTPVDEPSWGTRSNDTYVAGGADVAAILAGYDNVNNALAGLIASQHAMIYTGATHAAIFGGSLHTIETGSDYAGIWGGANNWIDTDCDYGVIVGGDQNVLEAGASFPTDYGHRGVVVGGTANNVSGQFGLILSGSGNSITGQKGSIINGVSCVSSGLHATAFGNGCTASAAYSFVGGVSSVASGARAVAWGDSHSISHDYATGFGSGCVSPHYGANTFATRQRGGTAGNNVAVDYQCSNETTDTTTTRLSLAGSSTWPTQPESSLVSGFAIVNAVKDDGTSSAFQIDFVAERVGSATATLRQNATTTKYNGLALGTVPTMNVTTGGIYRVQVVGLAATNIRWDARVCVQQTLYV